jgi:RNA-directed DNA polymerase
MGGKSRALPWEIWGGAPWLIEEVLRRENVLQAYKRVVAKEGAPGVDGMTVENLGSAISTHTTTFGLMGRGTPMGT